MLSEARARNVGSYSLEKAVQFSSWLPGVDGASARVASGVALVLLYFVWLLSFLTLGLMWMG
jgi:hypothetical protein